MALEQDELRRRIAAAIAYAGLSQDSLGNLIKPEGAGKKDPEQISRGEKPMQLQQAQAFSRHTGFPPEWFLEVEAGPRAVDAVLGEILSALTELRADVASVRKQLGDLQSQKQPDERDQVEGSDS